MWGIGIIRNVVVVEKSTGDRYRCRGVVEVNGCTAAIHDGKGGIKYVSTITHNVEVS